MPHGGGASLGAGEKRERGGSPDGKWRTCPLFESGKPQQTRLGLRNWERHRGQSDFRDDGSALRRLRTSRTLQTRTAAIST